MPAFLRARNGLKRRSERGVSLLEMMIALVIFVVGLLAIGLLAIKGMAFTRDSAMRTQAIYAARALGEAIKANPGVDYRFNGSAGTVSTTNCPLTLGPRQLAANDDCACIKMENDIGRAFQALSKLPDPSTGGKIEITLYDLDTGLNPGNNHRLAPLSCATHYGAAYLVKVRWSEGGGAAFGSENDQSASIVVQI